MIIKKVRLAGLIVYERAFLFAYFHAGISH